MDTPASATTYEDRVAYGEQQITFDVTAAERTTLGLHVHPCGRVEVRAPVGATRDDVRARVHRRARWILRHQRRFAELVQAQPDKEYVSGETHLYLGRQYRLRVIRQSQESAIEGGGYPEGVRLVGRYFEILSSQPDDPDRTRALLGRWYREKAEKRLRERFERGCALMATYGVGVPMLQVRQMGRRWGSCTPTGRVLLNRALILAPTGCIDYVVAHELCHLKHPNHGAAFYELLRRVMPEWESWKARLERVQ